MLEFKKKDFFGKTIHISTDLRVPFSTVKPSHSDVEKFVISKNIDSGIFEVGVWDSVVSGYDLSSYSDCNSMKLKQTIERIDLKYRGCKKCKQ